MAVISDNVKKLFPLKNIDRVIELFKSQMGNNDEPNLTLLSLVIGCIENLLTCNRIVSTDVLESGFPPIEFSIIETLYSKFKSTIKGSVDVSNFEGIRYANRELIKKVSDVIWGSLTRSFYKDRAHLQNLYSYLTGNKLDCFGVAFAVVAACQILGFDDVHLVLSEDHAWVTFGKDEQNSAEVTWHGKGNEDKRGQPVSRGTIEKSWLYANGRPVICTRPMEVAALVSGMNPSINATTDSSELAQLQQSLLWVLYDRGDLSKYPMALGNLGDLEDDCTSPGRPPQLDLFKEAIISAKKNYANTHVYPYTYLGGYLYRSGCYKEALAAWADAADVIRGYNYSRDDEEIYKEFLEIANELIPHAVKVGSVTLLKEVECFGSLVRFYDGICAWEEESSTPVLHIGWAKPFVSTITKFSVEVRSSLKIVERNDEKEEKESHNGENGHSERENKPELIKSLVETFNLTEAPPHPNIAALAAACSDNILNPDYLLGSGEPFSPSAETSNGTTVLDSLPCPKKEVEEQKVVISSKKMINLKELLTAEKLNTSAIQLLLTAQSQVLVKRGGRQHPSEPLRHTKRSRRD